MTILDKIILNKRKEVTERKVVAPLSSFINKIERSDRDFLKAIKKEDKVNIISEIKKSAPSSGDLRTQEEVLGIARIYDNYASAISVITDKKYFNGDLHLLKKIRSLTSLPVLCKDFIIDDYQIYEARLFEADAVLLITSVLNEYEINKFYDIARHLKMDVLLEVKNTKEMEFALTTKVDIIGVNNRNLADFSVDLNKTLKLARSERDKIFVSESGFYSVGNIRKVEDVVDAVLVGTSLMKSNNPEKLLKELTMYDER